MPATEPIYGQPAPAHAGAHLGAFSEAPGDHQNRVAQAGHVAAHHAEAAQHITSKSKNKRVDEANLAKLVAEENASKSKFPRYPGLERWELLEKMGDGAFSNVYRARDLQGEHGEVGIKVVRKYEMNSMQVSVTWVVLVVNAALFFVLCQHLVYSQSHHLSFVDLSVPTAYTRAQSFSFYQLTSFRFTNQRGPGPVVGKQTSSSGL
jgi:hypothetical protein